MRRKLIVSVWLLVCALFAGALVRPATADGGFHKVPAPAGKKASALQLRVLAYDGAVNGELTVEIKNTGRAAASFSASGLYFVPDGDPDQAPQRLGAVGPMQLARGDGAPVREDEVSIAPGASVRVTLDVFCIDSHRPAPTTATPFTVAATRMPKRLASDIAVAGRAAAAESGGYAAPPAKAAIQSAVWSTRDAKWQKLDGEGKQEADK